MRRMSQDEHPRPLQQRSSWQSLHGAWDFFIDPRGEQADPQRVPWDSEITVPFSPETEASGIGDTGFYLAVWYRRKFRAPERKPSDRLLLHFEAVDYRATVWVNGSRVCEHEGGYTPFGADITAALGDAGELQEIIVRAEDDPADLAKPRGKQDWKLEPHSIWYPRTTGIWQTVWLEVVPESRIDTLHWTCSLERWEIGLGAAIICRPEEDLTVSVKLSCDSQLNDC